MINIKNKKTMIFIGVGVLAVVAIIGIYLMTTLNAEGNDDNIVPVGNTSSEVLSSDVQLNTDINANMQDDKLAVSTPNAEETASEEKEKEPAPVPTPVVDVNKTVAEPAKPEWTETAFEKVMYTNTACNSRQKPIEGTAVINKYNVNAEVKVVAKTDKEYYKLSDNSYIHQTYVSDAKTEIKETTTTDSNKEFEGDLMPQANPDYARPANRNMPTFTVDTSVRGPQGNHGDFNGTRYYHVGLDKWLTEEYFYVFRYGQHPQATEYLPYAPQVSPYQEDGDYNPFRHGGDYHCKACNGWVYHEGWENGKHGSGKHHIDNTKEMNGLI